MIVSDVEAEDPNSLYSKLCLAFLFPFFLFLSLPSSLFVTVSIFFFFFTLQVTLSWWGLHLNLWTDQPNSGAKKKYSYLQST